MSILYIAQNGAPPTTSSIVKVTTGTSLKTMLQVATPTTTALRIVEWGISFDGSAAGTPIECELLQTDVAATVTSLTPTLYNDPNAAPSLCVGGTALTGYTSTSEGSITTTRVFDNSLVAPTGQYVHQFPLGREPEMPISKFLRIRVNTATAVNCYCWIVWEE
jgi:hypothetical protein